MKIRMLATVAVLALAPATVFAQGSTVGGAVGGAAVGAVVGGPVGAVVGAGVGGAVGNAAEPPREVVTYVERDNSPSVTVQDEIVVGRPVPTTVELRPVPQHTEFRYAYVNNSRVIVDSEEQALNEKGEFLIPLKDGTIGREHLIGDLGSVVCGRVKGRRDASERTMFLSGGTALEYMGTCSLLYERALAAGIGQSIDTHEIDPVTGQLE